MPYPIVSQRQRHQVRNPLPQELVDQVIGEKLYLVNVSDMTWMHNRTHGVYVVKPADERGFSVLEMSGHVEKMDEGEHESQQMTRVKEIAADICGACNNSIITLDGTVAFAGVFISETANPKRGELEQARARLVEFYQNQVAIGDQFWNDPHEHKNISGLMRRAAKFLGLKKPWVYDSAQQFVNCPACGETILPTVAVCKTCGAVIPGKEAEARKFFPERFPAAESKPQRRKPEATTDPE